MKTRKIWSIPIAVLALALMLAGAMAVTGLAQAQNTPSAVASISIPVTSVDQDNVLWYKILGYTPPANNAQTGAGAINSAVVSTIVSKKDASGATITDSASFPASFNLEVDDATDGTQYDRVQINQNSLTAGAVYEVRFTATYDKDITKAATDDPATTDINEAGGEDNTTVNDDLDGQIVTVVTFHVPEVDENALVYQVQNSVNGNVISAVGEDIGTAPRSFKIDSMGPGTASLSTPDGAPEHVTFHLVGTNMVQVKANANNLTEDNDNSTQTITIKHNVDHDLDGSTTDSRFTNGGLSLTVDIALAASLTLGPATTGLTSDETDAGIHYKQTIPETIAPDTGVLSYSVTNTLATVGESGENERAIPAERVSGLLSGSGSDLFRVINNGTEGVVEYAGPANGLEGKGGTEYVMNLTISGSTGIAGRHILTKVKVVVADVDSPPTVPATLEVDLYENAEGDGLVDDNTEVFDFKDTGSDPEGRALTFSTDAAGFDFDGTKLMVNMPAGADNNPPSGILDITATGDNPATDDETEDNWPSSPSPGGWAFSPDPATSMYPDQTRTIDVIASDGVQSNEQTIKVTVTLKMNAPVMKKADMSLTEASYKTTDVQNHVVVDLNDYVTGSDSPSLDKVKFVMTSDPVNPPFGEYSGSIRVNYPGATRPILDNPATADVDESWDPATDGWDIVVNVGDAFDNYDGKDCKDSDNLAIACTDALLPNGVDTVLKFNIKQIAGPPVSAYTPVFSVDENTAAGASVGTLAVEGAIDYQVLTGTGGAMTDFAVDSSTGAITVVNPRDYDAAGAMNTITLVLDAFGANGVRVGLVTATINIMNVNEAPMFAADVDTTAWVKEDAQAGHAVMDSDMQGATAYQITATDEDAGDTVSYSITPAKSPFAIDAMGNLTVKANNSLDREATASYALTITASDGTLEATQDITVDVGDANEAPYFVDDKGNKLTDGHPSLTVTKAEDTPVGTEIADFDAMDPENDVLTFSLKNQDDTDHFKLDPISGKLTIKKGLDYESQTVYQVEVNVTDPGNAEAEVQLTVNVTNVNDNKPKFNTDPPATSLTVDENTARDVMITNGNYSAMDADGDTVTYSLRGANAKSFMIDGNGMLRTLESLDYDSSVPCSTCMVTVVASDGLKTNDVSVDVTITVMDEEDSVSTVDVSKANPVPGTGMGDVRTALAGTKVTFAGQEGEGGVHERPTDLPLTMGDDAVNFVETDWANWGTVLRIEITAESPDQDDPKTAGVNEQCGNGNQCVVVTVSSDSGDHTLKVQAYRSATDEDKFIAAVKLVEDEKDATSVSTGTVPVVYKHDDGTVAALYVDEEDEVEIEFGNLRSSVDVENEDPEFGEFSPAHETAFDDADVDYAFTVTDDNSGMPEAEDLPDTNGNKDYTPVVALISEKQCESFADGATVPAGMTMAATIESGKSLYCPGDESNGEFVAGNGDDWGFAPIRDDKDINEISGGIEVETTIVLVKNKTFYVTFIACDNAGNCVFYDPDGNKDNKELAQITVDTEAPLFVEARTGLTWDSGDNEYDDNRSFIQAIFNDLTQLNPATVEIDDFVVEGHSIKEVYVYENPDDDDVNWGDSGDYAKQGNKNKRNIDRYRDLENSVFIELEDELLADETPDVTIVPNGVEDVAGKEQDDGEQEAKDWISPKFTVVSIVSPRETSQSQVLAGEDDEVVITVTSDERLDSTRPTVSVTYVNAPDGSVDDKGTATCTKSDGTDGTRERGEIVNNGTCQDKNAATGDKLTTSIEKVSNTEWIVTIAEPKDKIAGYYNFYINGQDRSKQKNKGSEGVNPDNIVTKFFDSDGDVNVDDAVFFEGDRYLPKPNVRVSGAVVTDNEANVEFRSPLFVELDFTKAHSDNCRNKSDDYVRANCMAETKEYAKDNFDSVTITMFELDGVDMTDMVKTTDDETFLISLESIALGDHTAKVQAVDQAGNTLEDTLEIDFEVDDRDPFEKRLSPGWNLVSLPGEPADSSIGTVFGSGVEVRTVYTYDPVVPGGWQVAVRETLDSDWQGDLTEITGQRGYWVLSDAIQDWEVNIPRLAGGAAGTGTPIQPPSIALYAGWNLIPVTDVTGEFSGSGITVGAYLNSLDDGLDLARVLGFDTIKNEWMTLGNTGMVEFGKGYWVFVREAGTLVPGQ